MFPIFTIPIGRPLLSQEQKQNPKTHQENRDDFSFISFEISIKPSYTLNSSFWEITYSPQRFPLSLNF